MSDRERQRARPVWLVPAVVVGVMAVLLMAVLVVLRPDTGQSAQPNSPGSSATQEAPAEVEEQSQPDMSEAERRDPGDLLAMGPVDAPVVLVVFSDYQCPFCAQWSEETLPLMVERAEAGDLRIEWRDVNVFGQASERAARASYAAALQGNFWEYHDALFADGEPRPEGELTDEALIALAEDLGLDSEQFATDLASAETVDQIARNARLGLDLGAYSTPAFVLGGQPIVGAQPPETFLDAFDEALAASES